jgi:hypothetical protein
MLRYIYISIFFLWAFLLSQHKGYVGAMACSGVGWVLCVIGDASLGKWGAVNRARIIVGVIFAELVLIFFGV